VGVLWSSEVDARASVAGFEVYELATVFSSGAHRLSFLFLGSSGPDRVRVWGSGRLSLTARMSGGDDVVRATRFDDVVFGGSGFDRAWAHAGHDRCRNVEVAVGCEVLR
jgi:hypothetical protein